MFEVRGTTDGTSYIKFELLSTTADLTEAGVICLGTILIVFVSVSTAVSYSLVHYRKRENIA